MTLGDKERLRQYNGQKKDAEAIGHAILAGTTKLRARVYLSSLDDLQAQIDALAQKEKHRRVLEHTRDDVVRAMCRQGIEADATWKAHVDALLAADEEANKLRRLGAEKARRKLEHLREFEASEASRQQSRSSSPDTDLGA